MKRFNVLIVKLLFCAVLLLSSSCLPNAFNITSLTKYMWEYTEYNDRIEYFYAERDNDNIVLIGRKYSYIFFDESNLIRTLLSLNQRGILTIDIEKTKLVLSANNKIKGKIVIHGPFDILPAEDIEALRFFRIKSDKNYNISIKAYMYGERYRLEDLKLRPAEMHPTEYKFPIIYYDSNIVKDAAKVVATPFTILIDITNIILAVLTV